MARAIAPTASLHIEWDPDPIVFGEAIMNVDRALNATMIPLQAAGAEVSTSIRQRFETETEPSGQKWAAWSENYDPVAKAFPNVGILRRTTELYKYVTSDNAMIVRGDALFFQDNKMPARGYYHQEGAPTRKTKGGAANPLPARPFLGLNMETRTFIMATFDEWFAESLMLYTTTLNKLGRRHAMQGVHPLTGHKGFIPRSTPLPTRPR
jgi:phage gpG-like protein